MIFQVLPEAGREGRAAAAWYDDQRRGLGDRFLAAVRSAFRDISARPLSFARWEHYAGPHEIRVAIVGRFPYVVVFAVRSERILILAISHAHRDPLYWVSRLD